MLRDIADAGVRRLLDQLLQHYEAAVNDSDITAEFEKTYRYHASPFVRCMTSAPSPVEKVR